MLISSEREPALSLRRVTGIFVLMAVILGIFSVRLFQVQIVQGEKYASLADADTKTTINQNHLNQNHTKPKW